MYMVLNKNKNRLRMYLFFQPNGKNTIQNNKIPEWSGVYFLWSKEMLLYIGSSKNLRKRIGQHLSEGFKKYIVNPEEVWKVSIILTKDEFDARRLESQLLKLIPTKNNGNWFYEQELFSFWVNDGFKDKHKANINKG